VINPIDQFSTDKDISVKGNISNNMTKLGIHIQISGNGHSFLKQKVWGQGKQGKRSAKKKEEVCHPTVYFSIIVSLSVDPKKILSRCTHEWTRNGGTRMNIQELQDISTETVVSMFRVSTATLCWYY
jgi:hypothetical protein